MSLRGFSPIPNWIIRDSSLPPSARLLYGVILSYSYGPRGCVANTETLCTDTGIGRSAFFESIGLLQARGLVEIQKRKSKNGWRNFYVPVAKGVEIPDYDDERGGRPEAGRRVVRHTDEGSSATRTQNKKKGEEEPSPDGSGTRERIPDDFPDELRPHARAVLKVLRRVAAEQPNARAVSALAVGNVLMARPRRPMVRAAYDMAAWAAGRDRPIRDVVATYRNWLDNTSDLATIEALPGEPSAPTGKLQRKAEADAAQARRHAARERLLQQARER